MKIACWTVLLLPSRDSVMLESQAQRRGQRGLESGGGGGSPIRGLCHSDSDNTNYDTYVAK